MGEWSQPTAADYARSQSDQNKQSIRQLFEEIAALKRRIAVLEAAQTVPPGPAVPRKRK